MIPKTIGRYEVKAEIGRGGMATVYEGYDPRFKREVAVKVLPREFLHDPSFRARFEREAETIATLEHPAIVPVHDYGEEDGQPYIIMRLMTGGSLADRLAQGPLSIVEVARVLNHLAPALDKAHARGIIHRDLKPGNILFDEDDQPYISDFGIAKLTQASATFTGTGAVGTPAYMSPEQARGERNIDGRSDLYALGTIVFQMLTGKFPYEADTPMGIAVKHITEPVPRILDTKPDLPPDCEALIQKAMAKNRDERYALAADMAAALTTIAGHLPIQPGATPLPETEAASETPPHAQPEAEPVHPAAPGAAEERSTGEQTSIDRIEQARLERIAREKAEAARRAEEECTARAEADADRIEQARLERLARERSEAERIAREKAERGRAAQAEAQRQATATTPSATAQPLPPTATRVHAARRGSGCAALMVFGGLALALFAFVWFALLAPPQAAPQARQATATARQATAAPSRATATVAVVDATALAAQTAAARSNAATTQPARQTAAVKATAMARADFVSTVQAGQNRLTFPRSGDLAHDADDLIESYLVEVNRRDFMAEAVFFNPYPTEQGTWDYGFLFRYEGGNQHYRLILNSDKKWELYNHTGTGDGELINQGDVVNFDTSASGSNRVRLICDGDKGLLYVNGAFVAELDLSARTNGGDVAVAAGMHAGHEIKGEATRFEGFTVWAIP